MIVFVTRKQNLLKRYHGCHVICKLRHFLSELEELKYTCSKGAPYTVERHGSNTFGTMKIDLR